MPLVYLETSAIRALAKLSRSTASIVWEMPIDGLIKATTGDYSEQVFGDAFGIVARSVSQAPTFRQCSSYLIRFKHETGTSLADLDAAKSRSNSV